MRALLTIFCWLIVSSSLFAQIQITSDDEANLYAVGKAWHLYSSENPMVMMDIGIEADSSQSWTVPNIEYPDTAFIINIDPANTPFADSFPSATHAQYVYYQSLSGDTSTNYTYFKLTPDSLIILGYAAHIVSSGMDTNIVTFNHQIAAILPITYGTSFSASRDSLNTGMGTYEITTKIVYYDAFGSIIMTNGTFNTIREMDVVQTDTYQNDSLVNSKTIHNFSWITKDNVIFNASIDTSSQISGNVTLYVAALDLIETYPNAVNESISNVPENFQLFQNYPNPFNPSTAISYQIPQSSFVTLEIFNVLGQKISTLVNANQMTGKHTVTWNGRDSFGKEVSTGIYFYRIKAGNFSSTKKMILLR
jgi:Secretion system C-terminal sorting domain